MELSNIIFLFFLLFSGYLFNFLLLNFKRRNFDFLLELFRNLNSIYKVMIKKETRLLDKCPKTPPYDFSKCNGL